MATVDEVRLVCNDQLVARHPRHWGREKPVFDPVHYLALLERKPGGVDHAKPLENWDLPVSFGILRRRLEAELGGHGTREFIKVLRLLERHSLPALKQAVQHGPAQHHLKTLKLPAMLAEHEKVAARCATDNVDHLGFLLQLCELELIDRERRAADRRLKSACFPNHKTLDAFDFKAQPSLNKVLITELMRGEYIDKRENILLVGNSGTGKTHIATALGIAACGHGRRVRFFQVTELITQLMEAREERVLMRLRKQLSKLDLLILDELGYVPASKVGSELLFDVISTAYERNSLIVTTNLPFENWTEVLSSERLTGATLDRLTHRCHILEASGESYRLRDAKRRKRPVRSSEGGTKTK